ncbi:MAG: hypothetical protein KAV00_01955 [Phycisphaerae bacterium]|nr:hypothetical protein [Phycisphaerae bacterium]
MEIKRQACDVFHVDDWPRVALDDVRAVSIQMNVMMDDGSAQRMVDESQVLCRKARERLLNGIKRLLKPPVKREKDSSKKHTVDCKCQTCNEAHADFLSDREP